MRIRRIHLAASSLACGLALAMAACGTARIGGTTKPDKVIDDLRHENTQLRAEVQRLNTQIDARLAELEAMRTQQGTPTPSGGVDVPRLYSVQIASFSTAVDTNNDGRDDTVRLYLVTRDQHDRILPVEGTAVVQLVAITPGQPPRTIAEKTYDIEAFRAAYRSGFTGTHYTLELQLPDDVAVTDDLTLKATVTDAATAITLSAQRPLKRTSRQQ